MDKKAATPTPRTKHPTSGEPRSGSGRATEAIERERETRSRVRVLSGITNKVVAVAVAQQQACFALPTEKAAPVAPVRKSFDSRPTPTTGAGDSSTLRLLRCALEIGDRLLEVTNAM